MTRLLALLLAAVLLAAAPATASARGNVAPVVPGPDAVWPISGGGYGETAVFGWSATTSGQWYDVRLACIQANNPYDDSADVLVSDRSGTFSPAASFAIPFGYLWLAEPASCTASLLVYVQSQHTFLLLATYGFTVE